MNQEKRSREGLAIQLAKPMGYAHEACHYAAARWLGLDAVYSWYAVQVKQTMTMRQALFVLLAPTLMGLSALVPFVLAVFGLGDFRTRVVALGILATVLTVWQMGCLADWYNVVYFLRHRQWLDYEDVNAPLVLSEFGKRFKPKKQN